MPSLTKGNFIFDSKLLPGWFSVAERAEVDAHDGNEGNWKGNILKSGPEKLTNFCGTCYGKFNYENSKIRNLKRGVRTYVQLVIL